MTASISHQTVESLVNIIYLMILEQKFAHAVVALFALKEINFSCWLIVREVLLQRSYDQKSLQMIASLIEAASRQTLAESSHFIPGLSVLAIDEDSQNAIKTQILAVA